MEEHSGLSLQWFFDQWLVRAGHPVLDGTWSYDSVAKKVIVELAQTGGDVYRLPLEVGIAGEGTTPMRIANIEMTQRQQRFEIAADKPPTAVKLDPNTWTLMEAKFGPK
jgi:aminopeptidase N